MNAYVWAISIVIAILIFFVFILKDTPAEEAPLTDKQKADSRKLAAMAITSVIKKL